MEENVNLPGLARLLPTMLLIAGLLALAGTLTPPIPSQHLNNHIPAITAKLRPPAPPAPPGSTVANMFSSVRLGVRQNCFNIKSSLLQYKPVSTSRHHADIPLITAPGPFSYKQWQASHNSVM